MDLRCNRRIKDGKEHRYWNIVESKRCSVGEVVVHSGVEVKLLAQELYVQAKSHQHIDKERAMRRRQLRALLKRLKELNKMKLNSSQTLPQAGSGHPASSR